ncbi:MAG: aminotransferase class I/II-fold pyridoxal phosphate-dependent enzyme, partial [Clostridium sp.]|nr:aminotransferase class I/II-fold pyridoxal phosphate-dependent enzyme [Clostridium sp.]
MNFEKEVIFMTYDFDQRIDRNHTWSIKHDFKQENGKPEDILPLWVADMDFLSPVSVTDALSAAVSHGIFGYTKADDSYFTAVASWYERRFGWKLQKEWLVPTPGVVFAISVAVRTFTSEGDAILIQPPVYHPFGRAIVRNHRTLVENPLILEDGHYRMDLADLEQKIVDNHVKLMILCNPHNPIGRVWTREELEAVS